MQTSDLIQFIDLTNLNEDATEDQISDLCNKASTPQGNVAAVCIYPQFVALAVNKLKNTGINVATVVNFPAGHDSLSECEILINAALKDGAHEIDVVMPYHFLKENNVNAVLNFISGCRETCGENIILKVILETGALSPNQIENAAILAIQGGADFLKTSTGKIKMGATPEAAKIILQNIKKQNKPIGFKVSGGIRTIADAVLYHNLTLNILGKKQLTADIFRIGASQLLDVILSQDKS
jgi:deoxyribose-phosphate aldolase